MTISGGSSVKGVPVRMWPTPQKVAATSDIWVDCRDYNAVNVLAFVSGTAPQATIEVLGAPAAGGPYQLLGDPNAYQYQIAASTAYDVAVGTLFVKIRLSLVTGSYTAEQGYLIFVTPFVAPANSNAGVRIFDYAAGTSVRRFAGVNVAYGTYPASATGPQGLEIVGFNYLYNLDQTVAGWQPAYPNFNTVVFNGIADATGGQTSTTLFNYNGRGVALLLSVTEVNGTGSLSAISLQALVTVNNWMTIYTFGNLGITTTGNRAFLIYPGAASAGGWTAAPIQGVVPYQYRLVTTSATNAFGNDLIYTLTAVHLL